MGIKEIKGRSLPGRSEEPSPDRPTTTISEAEGKRAATEHQRERSEFEQRKGSKAPRRAAKKGPELETSEFERGGRTIPLLNDPADDLERYPYPGQAGRHSIQEWIEQPAAPEKESEPDRVLWGDEYEGEDDDSGPEHEDADPDLEEDIAQVIEPVVEDLWVARRAPARPAGAAASFASEAVAGERNAPRADGAGPVNAVAAAETTDLWEAGAAQHEVHPALSSPQPPTSPHAPKQTSMIPAMTLEIAPVVAASLAPPPPIPQTQDGKLPQVASVIVTRTLEMPAVVAVRSHQPPAPAISARTLELPVVEVEPSRKPSAPEISARTQEIPAVVAGVPSHEPPASANSARTLELPVVELRAPGVLAPIPRGAQEHPPSDSPTQDVTAINAPTSDEAQRLLGEEVPQPTEVQDSADQRS